MWNMSYKYKECLNSAITTVDTLTRLFRDTSARIRDIVSSCNLNNLKIWYLDLWYLHNPHMDESVFRIPWYQLARWLDGPQSVSRFYEEEKNLFKCRESNPDHPACRPLLYKITYLDFSWVYANMNLELCFHITILFHGLVFKKLIQRTFHIPFKNMLIGWKKNCPSTLT